MLRKAIEVNGMTLMALTKLDVLNGLEELKICTHYRIDGKEVAEYPSDPSLLDKVEPVYETLPGWKGDISKAQSIEELPLEARRYLDRLQELCYNTPVLMVSVGADRAQTISVGER
jgi:adenylosuccinate synthase